MEITQELINAFGIEKTQSDSFGNGHINDTASVYAHGKRMILQKINTNIFKDPCGVMNNISAVTEFIRAKAEKNGEDSSRVTLTVVPTSDGKLFYMDENRNYYRMFEFIDETLCYEKAESTETMIAAAKTLGHFYELLSDFPAESLNITIPDFHNTEKYYDKLMRSAQSDVCARKSGVLTELEFAEKHKDCIGLILRAIESKEVPLRVTHNDTKLNNILFDKNTKEGLCVIDLDTVMPGSVLYDFGDAMRFGASSGDEDEKELEKIWFDLDMFDAFTKGFAENLRETLTKAEIELLADSVKIITLECGMRFLEDYLAGDVYFKTAYAEHNLDRARTQFKLVSDMEKKERAMKEIVGKYFNVRL